MHFDVAPLRLFVFKQTSTSLKVTKRDCEFACTGVRVCMDVRACVGISAYMCVCM